MDRLDEGDGREPLLRNRLFRDTPHTRDVLAMVWVADIAASRKLIAFLALLACTLTVSLTGDHGVAGTLASYPSAGDYEVDGCNTVVDTLRVVFDATRMQKKTRWSGPPKFGSLDDHLRWNSGNLGRVLGRVLLYRFNDFIEASGVLRNELAVDPAALDHDAKHAVEDSDIATGTHWDEQVGIARDWRHARIENDQLGTVLASLPKVVGSDGRTLGDVGTGH